MLACREQQSDNAPKVFHLRFLWLFFLHTGAVHCTLYKIFIIININIIIDIDIIIIRVIIIIIIIIIS